MTLKEFSEIFHDIESVKDKMLEADPNLVRSMTVHQHTAKILHITLYDEKEATTVQTTLNKYFFTNKYYTSILDFSKILN